MLVKMLASMVRHVGHIKANFTINSRVDYLLNFVVTKQALKYKKVSIKFSYRCHGTIHTFACSDMSNMLYMWPCTNT